MKFSRFARITATVASGAMLLQLTGCPDISLLEVLQTVLLGVTAAGSLVIIDNL